MIGLADPLSPNMLYKTDVDRFPSCGCPGCGCPWSPMDIRKLLIRVWGNGPTVENSCATQIEHAKENEKTWAIVWHA